MVTVFMDKLCISVKIFLMTKVLKCTFLREYFWCAPMLWIVLFEGAILMCIRVLKCSFQGSNFNMHLYFQMYFWGSNFEEHLCSEMHFFREHLFWSLWLLINVAAALCFHGCWLVLLLLYIFIRVFTTSKTFVVLTCINTSLEL